MPRSRTLFCYAVVAVAVIATGPLAELGSSAAGAPLSDIPDLLLCDRVPSTDGWKPVFAGADDARSAEFACQSGVVSVYIALWRTQAPGKEAVSEANRVVPHEWRFISASSRRATSLDFDVNEIVVGHEDAPMVIWTWYAIGGHPVASDFEAKVREALNAALFRRAPTAAFAVGARAATVEGARLLLRGHIAELWHAHLASQSLP